VLSCALPASVVLSLEHSSLQPCSSSFFLFTLVPVHLKRQQAAIQSTMDPHEAQEIMNNNEGNVARAVSLSSDEVVNHQDRHRRQEDEDDELPTDSDAEQSVRNGRTKKSKSSDVSSFTSHSKPLMKDDGAGASNDPSSEAARISVKKRQKKKRYAKASRTKAKAPTKEHAKNEVEVDKQHRRERRKRKKYLRILQKQSRLDPSMWPEWSELLRSRPKNEEEQAMAAWLLKVMQVSEKLFHLRPDLSGKTVHFRQRPKEGSTEQEGVDHDEQAEDEGDNSDQQISDISDPTCFHVNRSMIKHVKHRGNWKLE